MQWVLSGIRLVFVPPNNAVEAFELLLVHVDEDKHINHGTELKCGMCMKEQWQMKPEVITW